MNKTDILSDVLATLRLRGGLYFRAELKGTFAVEVPRDRRLIRFHLVRRGACRVGVREAAAPVPLTEGDLAIVPHGSAQVLANGPERRAVPLAELLRACPLDEAGVLRYGEGEGGVALLCGFCEFDEAIEHPVIAQLPDLIVLRSRDLGAEPWIATALRLMVLEADLGAQGSSGILVRQLETLLIQSLRRLPRGGGEAGSGTMAALADPQLSKALLAMHRAPEEPWTIDRLARLAGMSRARFAKAFAATLGEAPIGYLTRWRLMKARRLLRESALSTDEIARRCGYASLPSFSRRFKAAFGLGPGGYRRQAR